MMHFPRFEDTRGGLVPMEAPDLPFEPVRVFLVLGSAGGSLRGGHAHRSARQVPVCVAGAVVVELGGNWPAVRLRPDGRALLIGPGVWSTQRYGSAQDWLMVLSDETYDPGSYVEKHGGGRPISASTSMTMSSRPSIPSGCRRCWRHIKARPA